MTSTRLCTKYIFVALKYIARIANLESLILMGIKKCKSVFIFKSVRKMYPGHVHPGTYSRGIPIFILLFIFYDSLLWRTEDMLLVSRQWME